MMYTTQWQQHQANIATALSHRIQSAQAKHDYRLLEVLAQEQEALLHDQLSTALPNGMLEVKPWWLKALAAIRESLEQCSQVSVEQVPGRTGTAWRVHDPRTGKSRYAQSAAEVMEWIEANRLGH